jgi:hypothetical protein
MRQSFLSVSRFFEIFVGMASARGSTTVVVTVLGIADAQVSTFAEGGDKGVGAEWED